MIILDAGNSTLRAARWSGKDSFRPDATMLEPLSDIPSAGVPTPRDAATATSLAVHLADARVADEAVVLFSVVPAVTLALAAALPGLRVVDHRSDLPFATALDDPPATGADRFANVAAAAACGWRDAVVVDVGTATTFDVLRDGVFVGGLIAPGMALAADALGERAARLEPEPFRPVPLAPGAGTAAAMAAGAYHVGVSGVLGVLDSLRGMLARETDDSGEIPAVATGGLAGLLADPRAGGMLPAGTLIDPDWTLKGAAVLARRDGGA